MPEVHAGLEEPLNSFFLFVFAWSMKPQRKKLRVSSTRQTQPLWQCRELSDDVLQEIYRSYTKNLNGLDRPVYALLDPALKALGRITPLTSPKAPKAPGAPKAPSRQQRLALAVDAAGGSQASGQPLATAVRALFADVPAVVPDA